MLLKIFLSSLALCAATVVLPAQITVDNVKLDDHPEIQFIQLSASPRGMTKGIYLRVDYGEKSRWGVRSKIVDAKGKEMEFASVMDAVNFFVNNGWELFAAFSGHDDDAVYQYVLKRKK